MIRNICLIGLPHSGKTMIGKRLYKRFNKGFIDTDDIIRAAYDCDLASIINKYGHQEFLKIERDVVQSLICENTIISTGGSVIYHKSTMEHLKHNLHSYIYHLELDEDTFYKKANDLAARGVVYDKSKSLQDFYKERIHLYNKYADFSIHPTTFDDPIFFC